MKETKRIEKFLRCGKHQIMLGFTQKGGDPALLYPVNMLEAFVMFPIFKDIEIATSVLAGYAIPMKAVYINKHERINSELFDRIRRSLGLSKFGLAIEVNMSPATASRALTVGSDPRPSTIRKLGRYLKIPPEQWYVPRESVAETTAEETEEQKDRRTE